MRVTPIYDVIVVECNKSYKKELDVFSKCLRERFLDATIIAIKTKGINNINVIDKKQLNKNVIAQLPKNDIKANVLEARIFILNSDLKFKLHESLCLKERIECIKTIMKNKN